MRTTFTTSICLVLTFAGFLWNILDVGYRFSLAFTVSSSSLMSSPSSSCQVSLGSIQSINEICRRRVVRIPYNLLVRSASSSSNEGVKNLAFFANAVTTTIEHASKNNISQSSTQDSSPSNATDVSSPTISTVQAGQITETTNTGGGTTSIVNNNNHESTAIALEDMEDSEEIDELSVSDIYEKIGIEPDQLALGVKASEFLKYIGTREQLIEKTMKDIESFDRKKAEFEVSKFMMDAEMVNLYIQYGKEIERDPNFVVPNTDEEQEGFFSFRTLVIAYLGYVAYDTFPRLFRNWVYDQQVEGTWSGTNIPFIDDWIESTTPAISAAKAAAASVASTMTTNVDIFQTALNSPVLLSQNDFTSIDVTRHIVGSTANAIVQSMT